MRNAACWLSVACGIAVITGPAGVVALDAEQQPPTVTRTVLLQQDMGIPGREALMVRVDLPAGAAEGRHTHNAELYVFVQEGAISLEREGQPTASLKAGDVFRIAPGSIHQAINQSSAPARLAAVFIAEKGKPLTTPAK
jgi:quercetin dioxygenase-like cupin family protein